MKFLSVLAVTGRGSVYVLLSTRRGVVDVITQHKDICMYRDSATYSNAAKYMHLAQAGALYALEQAWHGFQQHS